MLQTVDIGMEPIQDNSTARYMYQTYQCNARKSNRVFDISYEQFLEMTRRNCEYCGKEPAIRSRKGKKRSGDGYYKYPDFACNGLDRIDNNQGYVIGNVVTCCSICNYAKRKMTVEQFIRWATDIYSHQCARISEEMLT